MKHILSFTQDEKIDLFDKVYKIVEKYYPILVVDQTGDDDEVFDSEEEIVEACLDAILTKREKSLFRMEDEY